MRDGIQGPRLTESRTGILLQSGVGKRIVEKFLVGISSVEDVIRRCY